MEPEFLTVEKVSRLLLVYGNSYDPQDPVEHDEAPEGSGLAGGPPRSGVPHCVADNITADGRRLLTHCGRKYDPDEYPSPLPSIEYAAREGEGLCPACVQAVCGRLAIRCQKQQPRDVEET